MMRHGLQSEGAFTLIEVLVAVAIVSVGVFSTLSLISSAHQSNFSAERVEVATEVAQREMEQMESLGYSELALTATPSSASDENLPSSRVSVAGTDFEVRSGQSEPLAIDASGGAVAAGPSEVNVGDNAATVYRYVTWVNGSPQSGCTENCSSTQDFKRLTVAVRVPGQGPSGGFKRYVEVTKYRIDPDLGPGGQVTQPDDPNPTQAADNFYLYDTQQTSCSATTYSGPSQDHATHDTRGACGAADAPDLMGLAVPPNPAEPSLPPLYDYSNDLMGSYDGGLALARASSGCSVAGAAAHEMHAWSTDAVFGSAYEMSGKLSIDLWTATIGGATGDATICFGVFDRNMVDGVAQDALIAEKELSYSSWPTTPSNVSVTFSHSPHTLAAGHRLLLVAAVDSGSDNDLQFLYDHPSYTSFVEVLTTTPVSQ